MNILLLENKYKKKYRNLALMKFSTYFKRKGYNIDFFNGIDIKNTLKPYYDIICFSTIFTYYFEEDIKTILYYKNKYPNAELIVGGISATLLSDMFLCKTGIMPHIGLLDEIDSLPPDYSLFPEHFMFNTSEVFTSRGCKNKCEFCAVKILEPKYFINENWKESIDLTKKNAMIHDNNLTTGDIKHFKNVMDYLKQNKITSSFDNGFDCRFFNDEHLQYIKGVNFEVGGLRFSFDNMTQDKYIQKTIKMCLDAGISKRKIMVFILFNFKDTFDEAMYRANEIKNLGIRPYPQQYRPLNDIILKNNCISENWNKKLLRDYRFYWMMPGIHTKITWHNYINKGGINFYDKRS